MPKKLRQNTLSVLVLLKNALVSYHQDGCYHLAASISFYALLSLTPLLFFSVSFVGVLLGTSEDALYRDIDLLKKFIPYLTPELLTNVRKLISHPQAVGLIGICILILCADLLFFAVEHALNAVFKSPKQRKFIYSKFLSLCIIIGGQLAIMGSFSLPAVNRVLKYLPGDIFGSGLVAFLARSEWFGNLSGLVLLAVFLGATYIIIPHHQVKLSYAVGGGVLCALLFALAKHLFSYYVTHVTKINLIYGSLGTIFLFLLWVFYSAAIYLFVAELLANLMQGKASHKRWKRER